MKRPSQLGGQAFKKALYDLDVDVILDYIKQGGDINIEIVEDTLDWDGSIPMYGTRTVRPLDVVKRKSEELARFFEERGAFSQSYYVEMRRKERKEDEKRRETAKKVADDKLQEEIRKKIADFK